MTSGHRNKDNRGTGGVKRARKGLRTRNTNLAEVTFSGHVQYRVTLWTLRKFDSRTVPGSHLFWGVLAIPHSGSLAASAALAQKLGDSDNRKSAKQTPRLYCEDGDREDRLKKRLLVLCEGEGGGEKG